MSRILVIAPNWIGDALMSLPMLARLKASVPSPSITVFAPSAVAAVLKHSPLVDEVLISPWGHGGLQLWSRFATARRLAERRFDLALVLPNSLKSALLPFFAGIPKRLGYLGEARRGLLTQVLPNPGKDTPMVQRYEALWRLSQLSRVEDVPAPMPTLRVDPQAINAVAQRFGFVRQDPVIVFCPGAEYGPAKRWPVEHFARLAELIKQAHPRAQIVLAGASGDAATCRAIVETARTRSISTAGETSVEEAIALLAGAALVVSNDSGVMHVAAALKRPLVALYGSTDPRHTPPQSTDAAILWLHLECSPCFQRICPLGHFRCLTDLSPEQVLAAIPSGVLH